MSREATIIPEEELELFKGKTIYVTAGTTGIGAEVTRALLHRGADHVIASTRDPAHFNKLVKRNAASIDNLAERLVPSLMDITQPIEIDRAMQELDDSGLHPDHVVMSAAGGMNMFVEKLGTTLSRISVTTEPERTRLLQDLQIQMEAWVSEAWQDAQQVNYFGPVMFTDSITSRMNPGGTLINLSSLLSTNDGPVPIFYKVVAGPKKQFEQYLKNAGPMFSNRGVHRATVTGNLVPDTITGMFLKRYLFPFIPKEDLPDVARLPMMADMAQAVIQVLASNPNTWPQEPYYRYVMGKDDIRDSISPDDPMLRLPLPPQFFPVRP